MNIIHIRSSILTVERQMITICGPTCKILYVDFFSAVVNVISEVPQNLVFLETECAKEMMQIHMNIGKQAF